MKRSPFRDVAGMLRSFHDAAYAELAYELNNRPGWVRRILMKKGDE